MFDADMLLTQEAVADISFGTVAAAGTDGVVLKLDGEDAPSGKAYRRLASYTPDEGDRVYVVKAGAELLVIGKVV